MSEIEKEGRIAPERSGHQKTYHIFEVMERGRVWIRTTDPETLEEIIEELKTIIPGAKIDLHHQEFPEKTRGGVFCAVHNLNGKDDNVALWVMRRLGEKSWEPFAVYPNVSGGQFSTSSEIHYCFRKSTLQKGLQKPEANK